MEGVKATGGSCTMSRERPSAVVHGWRMQGARMAHGLILICADRKDFLLSMYAYSVST